MIPFRKYIIHTIIFYFMYRLFHTIPNIFENGYVFNNLFRSIIVSCTYLISISVTTILAEDYFEKFKNHIYNSLLLYLIIIILSLFVINSTASGLYIHKSLMTLILKLTISVLFIYAHVLPALVIAFTVQIGYIILLINKLKE